MKGTSNLLAKLFASYSADFNTSEKTYHFSLGFRIQNNVNTLDALELAYGFTVLQDLIHFERDHDIKKILMEIKTVGILSLYKSEEPQHKTIIDNF